MKNIKILLVSLVVIFLGTACSEKVAHQYALPKDASLVYNYGLDVMAANHAVLTPYGLVQRRDGNELLQAQEPPSERSGMEMMQ